MKVKGTAVQSIKLFVQENFTLQYDDWLENPDNPEQVTHLLITSDLLYQLS